MEVYTWLSAISTKAELISLVSLVEEGTLEELFVAQCLDKDVAGQPWKVGQIIVFSFSASKEVESKLQAIASSINLDILGEEYFEVIDDVYMLKSVLFPEAEAQEEQIIAQLV